MSFTDELKKLDPLEEQQKLELNRQRELAEAKNLEKKRREGKICELKGLLQGAFKAANIYGLLNEGSYEFCLFNDCDFKRDGIVICSEDQLGKIKKDETLTGIVKEPLSGAFVKHQVYPFELVGDNGQGADEQDCMLIALRELGFRNVSVTLTKCKYRRESFLWALLGNKTTMSIMIRLYHFEF